MTYLWPSEEPFFKKLTDEEINNLEGERLETQLRIDKRNRANYRFKVLTYSGLGFPASWLIPLVFNLSLSVPSLYYGIPLVIDVFCVYFSVRAYLTLVRYVSPQVKKLLKRKSELQPK